MKKFFIKFFNICESIGRARAASYFTRLGDYEAAKKVMTE